MAYSQRNPNGQATMANSSPVVIASDQSTLPVSVSTILAAAALADNTANPTVGGLASFGMMYDGSTWDRLRGDSTDGLLVNLGANNDVTVTGAVNATIVAGLTEYTEDAVAVANPIGGMLMARIRGTLAAEAADGDVVALNATETGALYVKLVQDPLTIIGTVSVASGATSFVKDEDSVSNSGDAGVPAMAIRKATPANLSNNDGDYEMLQMSAGRLWVDGSGVNLTVVGTGTLAVQESGSALTSLQLIDDVVYTDDTSTHATGTSKGILMMGAATPTDTAVNANDIGALAMTLNRELLVQVNTALPAGSNAIGKLAANTGVTIGAVEIAASQTLATVTTVSTLTTLTGGGIAHDSPDSGNPIKVGAKAVSTLATATMVSAADRTDAVSDVDGSIITRMNFPLGDLKSDAASNTDGASTASSVFTAVASTRNYITGIHVYRTDTGTTPIYIDFRDGTAGSVLWRQVLPPNGGSITMNSGVPFFRTTANTALAYDVSAATTTVYINVSGFQSKA